ncbi:MAG TPA: hypothetical protein VF855_00945 [Acidimicrobiales bacterium]
MNLFLPDTRDEADPGLDPVAWAVVLASTFLGAVAGASPTGNGAADLVFTALLTAAATWAAASAPWWAGTTLAATALAATATTSVPLATLAGGTLVASVLLRVVHFDRSWSRALVGAVAVQVLLRLPPFAFLGAPSLVAGVALSAVVVVAVMYRPPGLRLVALCAATLLGVSALAATIAVGVAANDARTDLQRGADHVRDGLDSLEQGDTAGAASRLRLAAGELHEAQRRLEGGFARTAAVLPVVAQHRRLTLELTDAAAAAARQAGDALAAVDLEGLGSDSGRVDLAAIRSLQRPLADVRRAIADLDAVLADDGGSPWIVQPLRDELDEMRVDVADAAARAEDAAAAAAAAPTLLGQDRSRTWLVGFVDSDGGVGAVVGYALLTATDGVVTATELTAAPEAMRTLVTDGVDFAAVAPRVAALAGSSTGAASPDVVMTLDTEGIAALLQVTGPVEVPSLQRSFSPDELAAFLRSAQQSQPDSAAVLLAVAGEAAIRALLAADLPGPVELARVLARTW